MFDFMLDASSVVASTLGEKLSIGGQVTLLGMGTVFAVLALLWGLVELLHVILSPFSAEKKARKAVEAPIIEKAPVKVMPAPQENATDECEIVAAITAAIADATGASPLSFRVVSFKRANNRFSTSK